MKPSFTAGVYFDRKIWFSDNNFNALMNMDINTGECRFISSFSNEDKGELLIHRNAFCYGKKIIFTPNQGKNIHIYDTETGGMECISICKNNPSRYFFSNAFIIDGKIWLCPGNISFPIHIVDIVSKEIGEVFIKDRWPNNIESTSIDEEHFFMWEKIDGILIAAMNKKGLVIRFDIKTRKYDIVDIKITDIDSIYYTGSNIWMCGMGKIYKWDCVNNPVEYEVIGLEEIDDTEGYRVCGNDKTGIYVFRFCGGDLYELRGRYFEKKQILGKIKRTSGTIKGFWYDGYTIVDDKILVFPPYEADCYMIENSRLATIKTFCSNIIELKEQIYQKAIIDEVALDLNDLITVING